MAKALALDSNLILLFAVGRAEQGLVSRHKRLSVFNDEDCRLLAGYLLNSRKVVATPNALTEAVNLASYGQSEPSLSRIMASLKSLINQVEEVFVPSRKASEHEDFFRLGLTDCAWLSLLDSDTDLLTMDRELYATATRRGFNAVNFHHVRAGQGHG